MTHAELRQSLPAYADGTLAAGEAEVVRAHLATGCPECLGGVFTRPVGLPRTRPVVARRRSSAMLLATAVGVVAVGLGVWALLALRRGDLDRHAVETIRQRVEKLEAQGGPPTTELSVAASTPSTSVPPPTGVAPSEPAAAANTDAVPAWLEELLSSQAARVMALGAADFAPGASGYAVWSPARGVVVVSASGLPNGGRQPVYRVRVALSDGSTVWVGDLTAADHGTLLVTVAMPDADGRRVTGVDLYRDPPGTPALTATLRPERAGESSLTAR